MSIGYTYLLFTGLLLSGAETGVIICVDFYNSSEFKSNVFLCPTSFF